MPPKEIKMNRQEQILKAAQRIYAKCNKEKKMKKIILTSVLFLNTGCGVWYAEWQGEVNKTALKANGEAQLLEAESSKKIAVESAKAQLESAKLLAQAEIERAKGVAEANKIIGNSLKGNEAYLRYLYISNLEKAEGNGSVNTIYIPTEAGLPILEAGKR